MELTIRPIQKLEGRMRVPGDKSISHRAVMLGAIAQGTTDIEGFLLAQDCLSTVRCMQKLGVPIEVEGTRVRVKGQGLYGLKEPDDVLDVGNSGTTIRLLSGILAGQSFVTMLNGDESIRRRPMGRVTEPLSKMGARITGRQGGTLAPLAIQGGDLRPLCYQSVVASAQVKSAVLLAALYAQGETEYMEPTLSRNHTELMLGAFGATLKQDDNRIWLQGQPSLTGQRIVVPGDISSAAFFMVAGLIMKQGEITIESVGINPTRTGILDVLQAMGGRIRVSHQHRVGGELMGDVHIEPSQLQGVAIGGALIPRLIDEIPILAVAALFARGVTEIRDAAELKVKESNRISAMAQGLNRLGAKVEELPDGLRIEGGHKLQGARCQSFGDHRIAMALAIAGLRAEGETTIEQFEAVGISFPEFTALLDSLQGK